eukprot:g52698.t1
MSTTLVKRLPLWRCEVTGCDSVNFFTQSKCRACNALCPLFMAQPDPRNWAVSDVLAIHGAFKNSVDLLDIAEKGIGGTLSMTGVLSAVNAVPYCERADYMFWDIVSDNSGEKETEAGNAQSAMEKAKRSRPPSKKVLGNAEQ